MATSRKKKPSDELVELKSASKRQKIEKKLNKEFDVDADDSSDDEDSMEEPRCYTIGVAWRRFQKKSASADAEQKVNHYDRMFSFVAHAAGIYLRHLPEINEVYRHLKVENLRSDASVQVKEMVAQAYRLALQDTVRDMFPYLSRKPLLSEDPPDEKMVRAYVEKNMTPVLDTQISKFIERVRGEIVAQKSASNALNKAILKHFSKQDDQIISSCAQTFIVFVDPCFVLQAPRNVSNVDHSLIELLYKEAINKLRELAIPLTDKQNNEAKQQIITAVKECKNDSFKNLLKTLNELMNKWQRPLGRADNYLKNTPENKKLLAKAFLADLIELDKQGSPEVWRLSSGDRHEWRNLRLYLLVNKQRFSEDYRSQFSRHLNRHLLIVIRQFNRGTLGNSFFCDVKNSSTFFAYRRLVDRSQRRKIKDLKQGTFQSGFLSGNTRSLLTVTWQFNGDKHLQFVESQKITNTKFNRVDKVEAAGSYSEVLKRISEIQKKLTMTAKKIPSVSLTDDGIAKYVRLILKGELNLQDFKDFTPGDRGYLLETFAGMASLLLGCEGARNPAMVVINQMMLDLIINKRLTWKEALDNTSLDGTLMPMAPTDAVNAARQLNDHYKDYMSHPYRYDEMDLSTKSSFTPHQLVVLEARMVRCWAAYQCQLESSASIDDIIKWLVTNNVIAKTEEFMSWLYLSIYDFNLKSWSTKSKGDLRITEESEEKVHYAEISSESDEEEDLSDEMLEAASVDDVETVVRLVTEHKASVNYQDPQTGYTALHHAVEYSHEAMVDFLLLQRGIRLDLEVVESEDNLGHALPIHIAAHRGHVGIIRKLVEKDSGATIDDYEYCGYTPLHETILEGHIAAFKLLVELGADLELPTDGNSGLIDIPKGLTCLELAKYCRKEDRLLSKVADKIIGFIVEREKHNHQSGLSLSYS